MQKMNMKMEIRKRKMGMIQKETFGNLPEFCSEVRSAENEYENGNSKKENGYDTKRNILRKIILRSRK